MLQTLPQQRKKETSTGKMSFAITVQYVFESGGRRTLMYSSKLNNVSIQLHYITYRHTCSRYVNAQCNRFTPHTHCFTFNIILWLLLLLLIARLTQNKLDSFATARSTWRFGGF
jgi:hypothetical protein